MYFSLIIPVFNRPNEIDELLKSLVITTYAKDFEIVIVEDGSTQPCHQIIEKYNQTLEISYYFKNNSGPGDSRNYGMRMAKGDYFIIFDSDCLIPQNYLRTVDHYLATDYADCFGGPDKAHESFSDIQKAVDFAMTSVLTTGGIRGASEKLNKFQPRSFNMGISRKAFEASNGFGHIHPGEDPDLSIRLWKLGFQTKLYREAYVYHKRRISWEKFYQQVHKFGMVRPILNKWHPEYSKITYLFPSLFIIGFLTSILFAIAGYLVPIYLYVIYLLLLFFDSFLRFKNFKIAALSVYASMIQFYGYGTGFLKSILSINIMRREPQEAFPNLFFKK